MIFRIGERDAATGLYQVIWPDGGMTLNGIKIFNAEHRVGDVVEATQRSDGMMILDGPKAIDEPVGLFDRGAVPGGKPDGYLRGQIWNDDEKTKDNYTIELLPLITSNIPAGDIPVVRLKRSDSVGSIAVTLGLFTNTADIYAARFGPDPNTFIIEYEVGAEYLGVYLMQNNQSYIDVLLRVYSEGSNLIIIRIDSVIEVLNNTIDINSPVSNRYRANTKRLTIS